MSDSDPVQIKFRYFEILTLRISTILCNIINDVHNFDPRETPSDSASPQDQNYVQPSGINKTHLKTVRYGYGSVPGLFIILSKVQYSKQKYENRNKCVTAKTFLNFYRNSKPNYIREKAGIARKSHLSTAFEIALPTTLIVNGIENNVLQFHYVSIGFSKKVPQCN